MIVAPDILTRPHEWMERAACKGNDEPFHHPENERGLDREVRHAEAASVCAGCDVADLCRAQAESTGERWAFRAGRCFECTPPRAPQPKTPPTPKKPAISRPICGTSSGSNKHSREGEEACPACKAWRKQQSAARRSKTRAQEAAA